ncbi:dihydrofolate reductase [Spirochaetia bacterium]|nr:dihydrofolate reductase [Spirochaetia bacterium]
MKQEIIIIAAMSENRVIGINNALPWSIKEDMHHFRDLTGGCPCIMGRKTWESLPRRPLPNRTNIVISTTLTSSNIVEVFSSLQAALDYCTVSCSGKPKLFICGGSSVYREAVKIADRIELTLVHRHYDGDAFFPDIFSDNTWVETSAVHHEGFSFLSLVKNASLTSAAR